MIRFPKIRFDLLRAFSLSMLSFIVTKEELTPEELHQYYLENSPYKETKNLSKKDRFERGLPPNQFHEQLYELTINPITGVPQLCASAAVCPKDSILEGIKNISAAEYIVAILSFELIFPRLIISKLVFSKIF